MHNKQMCKIGSIDKENENLFVADEHEPELILRDKIFKRCLFLRMGLKNTKLEKVTFHQCIFMDCYLREAKFHNVDLTGSTFDGCNLEHATFQGCRFRYAKFRRCLLDYNEIIEPLPNQPNIALLLLKSLKCNALEIGDRKIIDNLLALEIEVEKQELKNRFRAVSSYYKARYNVIDRLSSFIRFTGLVFSGWFWGHGMKLKSLFRSTLFIVILFAILFYCFGTFSHKDLPLQISPWMSLYFSVVTFTTLGHSSHIPASGFTYILCGLESFAGVLFLGFFAASIYRKFAK
jgi:hypothetical protein